MACFKGIRGKDGTIIITFPLLTLVLIGLVSLSVDLGFYLNQRQLTQHSVDNGYAVAVEKLHCYNDLSGAHVRQGANCQGPVDFSHFRIDLLTAVKAQMERDLSALKGWRVVGNHPYVEFADDTGSPDGAGCTLVMRVHTEGPLVMGVLSPSSLWGVRDEKTLPLRYVLREPPIAQHETTPWVERGCFAPPTPRGEDETPPPGGEGSNTHPRA